MYERTIKKWCIINYKEIIMEIFFNIIQKIFIFEKEPQRIGLSQFKDSSEPVKKKEPSIKNKDVKLSDLMRRAS